MQKLTEMFAFPFLQSQIFGLTSFWRGARSRQRDTEMLMSLTWPPPGKVALLCVPSSIASGLTSCKWQLWSSSGRHLQRDYPLQRPEQPWHSAVPFCGCFLQGSAHHGQVWRGEGWGWVCFVSSVCPCTLFKMKYMCFQRARRVLNPMIYHVCGSHVSI